MSQYEIMKSNLPLRAKAVYMYISTMIQNDGELVETVQQTCENLKLDRTSFYKYRKMLIEKGLINVENKFRASGGYGASKYTIN